MKSILGAAVAAAVLSLGTGPAVAQPKPELIDAPFNAPGFYDFEITFGADGKSAVWASNRPGGEGGNDIYYAEYRDGAWGPAINLGPVINTAANEQEPSLSVDGNALYFTRYHDPKDFLSGDLYVSQKVDGQWQTARSWNEVKGLPALNTPDGEEHCPIIVNRDLIYFSTNRKGTQASDIWMVERKDGVWGEPRSMGAAINSPHRDHLHWGNLSKDGKSMLIISDRPDLGSFGGSEQWIVRKDEDGNWGVPTNLGPVVNSPGNEICWTTPPGQDVLIGASDRNGLAQGALYSVARSAVLTLQGFDPETTPPLNLIEE